MEGISINLRRRLSVTSAHHPHRDQVWTIGEIGVDRVIFSACYPYNARRLFGAARDA
jgi:hypothetical protein